MNQRSMTTPSSFLHESFFYSEPRCDHLWGFCWDRNQFRATQSSKPIPPILTEMYIINIRAFTDPENFYATANKFANRIMLIHNSTVTFDGLTFQYVAGDRSSDSDREDKARGAFITANRSAVTVNNCLFQYGQEAFHGMIVYARNETAPVQISNSVIQKSGDASLGYFNAENVSIDRSIFQELGNEER